VIAETYNYRRPIVVEWTWNNNTGRHLVVCDGYEIDGQWVYYMNPTTGDHRCSTYTWFKGGPGSGSDHAWTGTLYQMRRC